VHGNTNFFWDVDHYIRGAPLVGKDGTIYVGTESGTKFFAFNGMYGPANSRWPRFMQNPRNTTSGSLKLLEPAEVARRNLSFAAHFLISGEKKTSHHRNSRVRAKCRRVSLPRPR